MLKFNTNSKYSTVFFDWSGVIADDSGDKFIRQSLADVGATESQIQQILKEYFNDFMLGNLSETEYWNLLRLNHGMKIPNEYNGIFDKWSGINPNRDMVKLVQDLKTAGFKTGLITNIIKPVFNIIKQLGHYDIFNDIVASCETSLVKPRPEIYRLALNRLGTTAEKSIFIDDKQSNLDAASEMGFKTILAINSKQTIFDLKSVINNNEITL